MNYFFTDSACSRESCTECRNSTSADETERSWPESKEQSNSSANSAKFVEMMTKAPSPDVVKMPKYKKNSKLMHSSHVQSSNNLNKMRINIPKPELKVSKYSRTPGENSSHANILARPSAATISRSASQVDFSELSPTTIRNKSKLMANTSYSTDHVNQITGIESDQLKYQQQTIEKVPRPFPRIAAALPQTLPPLPQHHKVIDVVPKPLNRQQPFDWDVPDQTLGIPLMNPVPVLDLQYMAPTNDMAYSHQYRPTVLLPSHMQPSTSSMIHHQKAVPLLKSKSMYNIPVNGPPIIHHPLVSGNIPATFHSPENYTIKKQPLVGSLGPPVPLKPSNRHNGANVSSILSSTLQQNASPKKETGEKNKVKFSETVTVAVVCILPF